MASISKTKPRKITEAGLGHIPEDRHKHGLVLEMSLGENIVYKHIIKTYF